ncbi:MAG: potassium-transporting ATPase subunit KdpC [Gammaproteobacteria bacterium]
MLTEAIKQLKTSILLLVLFSILTGLIYPAVVTGLAQLLFAKQANGSLIQQDNKVIGSKLIGQYFNTPDYFWGRPSATTSFPYNAIASAGSNLGPTNPDLITTVKNRISILHKLDSQNQLPIPVDLVTASASGLDPEISPLAAFYQVSRVAKARNLPENQVIALIQHSIKKRFLWILGEPRVNVLQLNLALDNLTRKK